MKNEINCCNDGNTFIRQLLQRSSRTAGRKPAVCCCAQHYASREAAQQKTGKVCECVLWDRCRGHAPLTVPCPLPQAVILSASRTRTAHPAKGKPNSGRALPTIFPFWSSCSVAAFCSWLRFICNSPMQQAAPSFHFLSSRLYHECKETTQS